MRATLRASLLLLLAAGALSGCSRNNPVATPASSGMSSTQAQVTSEMTQQPGVVEDGVSDSEGESTFGATQGLAAIDPLTFWRRFEVRRRTFEFAYSDTDSTGLPTRAVVTIRTRLQGTFNILVGTPSDSTSATVAASTSGSADASRHVIHKPLDETRVRRVLLRRAPMPRDCDDSENRDETDNVRARWRLAAVSGVEVTSKDHTTTILSVRIQSGALDTTLTDPLAFIRLRGLLKLVPDSPVTLTVKTNHTDDVVLLHHNDHRLRLKSNGDGTYSGEFRSRLFVRGLWHFGIDAIAHATLYDDQAAYDSQRWVFPYVIAPWRMDGPGM
jgi:hypothetical protein